LQKKGLFQIKTAITFAYRLKKNYVIYEKISARKVTSDFNSRKPFAQNLASHVVMLFSIFGTSYQMGRNSSIKLMWGLPFGFMQVFKPRSSFDSY
jgi:hypothetical protein